MFFRQRFRRGFSLIELLSTITIILILAAMLFPLGSHVRRAALNAKTKAQFAQHILALEQYAQEYGHYPHFLGNAPVALEGAFALEYLASLSTQPLGVDASLQSMHNARHRAFYQFSEEELERNGGTVTAIIDAYGLLPICILVDAIGTGVLQGVPPDILEEEGRSGAQALLGSILMYTQAADGSVQAYCYE